MLHEILLALSGHPSPLFAENGRHLADDSFTQLAASERALLTSIGCLSELHRKARRHLAGISASHNSLICRSVANSIQQVHLASFQKHILEVESRILAQDAGIVGAYNIVPLAAVVGEFDDWHRRMAWYWEILCFMRQPSDSKSTQFIPDCSSAELLNKLRSDAQTGYTDIEQVAVQLIKVADTAWLRQVYSWIVLGEVPKFGKLDFFIHGEENAENATAHFTKHTDLLPQFVSTTTADSILFIGRSVHQVRYTRQQGRSIVQTHSNAGTGALPDPSFAKPLSLLTVPVVSTQLNRAVAAIRVSLSQNILQHLLPLDMTIRFLSCLRRYFLLDEGEFATALIDEAENRLHARQASMGKLVQEDPVKAMQGLSMKDAELTQALAQAWKSLSSREGREEEDAVADFARAHITLSEGVMRVSRPTDRESSSTATSASSSVTFNDLLFPIATSLGVRLDAPLDLFITHVEIENYSAINAYLLGTRRAHMRLTDLWRRSSARRCRPQSTGSRSSTGRYHQAKHSSNEAWAKQQAGTMRRVWATCSAAIFLLSETTAYLEGEVIRCSWDYFMSWINQPSIDVAVSDTSSDSTNVQRDPETLASGHRAFLAALTYALLLTDLAYTKEVRSLLGNIDQLVAVFTHLLDVYQKIDLEKTSGMESQYTLEQERKAALELDRARKRVDSDLRSVVNRLRQLDLERIGAARYLNVGVSESGNFQPWQGGGVDRLLMKLEFGDMRNHTVSIV